MNKNVIGGTLFGIGMGIIWSVVFTLTFNSPVGIGVGVAFGIAFAIIEINLFSKKDKKDTDNKNDKSCYEVPSCQFAK